MVPVSESFSFSMENHKAHHFVALEIAKKATSSV